MTNSESTELSKYQARLKTVQIFVEEKNRLFDRCLETVHEQAPETTPTGSGEIKSCRLGTPYFYSVVEMMEIDAEFDTFDEIDYEPEDAASFKNFSIGMMLLLEHYLNQVLEGTDISIYGEKPRLRKRPHGEILERLDESGLNWKEESQTGRHASVRSDQGILWINGLTYNTAKRMENRIRDLINEAKFEKEFKQALVKFPERFNRMMRGEMVSKKDFCTSLSHELTHYYLWEEQVEIEEEYESIEEAFAWFSGLSLFETDPNPDIGRGYDDPEEIETFLGMILRKSMDVEGSRIDWARKECGRILSTDNPRETFLDEMMPEDYLEEFERIQEICKAEKYNSAWDSLSKEIRYIWKKLSQKNGKEAGSLYEDINEIRERNLPQKPEEFWERKKEQFYNHALKGDSDRIKRNVYLEYVHFDGYLESVGQLEEDLVELGFENEARKLEKHREVLQELTSLLDDIYREIK